MDVDYSEIFSSEKVSSPIQEMYQQKHYMSIASQLIEHHGLNYVPRERNADGRVFEHASDCRVLIDHLASYNGDESPSTTGLHRKDGLRSQMASFNEPKSLKVDVKD